MLLMRLFIILILVLAGGGLVAVGLTPVRLMRSSRRWAATEGHITDVWSELWGLGAGVNPRPLWGVRVCYSFRIDGRRFDGQRRHFTIWRLGGTRRDQADALIARFAPGAQVTVWHDPDRPHASVLDRAIDWSAVATCLLVGALFLAMGAYYTLVLAGLLPAWE